MSNGNNGDDSQLKLDMGTRAQKQAEERGRRGGKGRRRGTKKETGRGRGRRGKKRRKERRQGGRKKRRGSKERDTRKEKTEFWHGSHRNFKKEGVGLEV